MVDTRKLVYDQDSNKPFMSKATSLSLMKSGTSMEEPLDECYRFILDLENRKITLDDEDQYLLLIWSLTSSYDTLA